MYITSQFDHFGQIKLKIDVQCKQIFSWAFLFWYNEQCLLHERVDIWNNYPVCNSFRHSPQCFIIISRCHIVQGSKPDFLSHGGIMFVLSFSRSVLLVVNLFDRSRLIVAAYITLKVFLIPDPVKTFDKQLMF